MKQTFLTIQHLLNKSFLFSIGLLAFITQALGKRVDFYCTEITCDKAKDINLFNEQDERISSSMISFTIMAVAASLISLIILQNFISAKCHRYVNNKKKNKILPHAQAAMNKYEQVNEVVINDETSLEKALCNNFLPTTSLKIDFIFADFKTFEKIRQLFEKQLPIKSFLINSFSPQNDDDEQQYVNSIKKSRYFKNLVSFPAFKEDIISDFYRKITQNLNMANQYADKIIDFALNGKQPRFNHLFCKNLAGREHVVIDRIKVRLKHEHGFSQPEAEITASYCYKKILDIKPFIRNGIVKNATAPANTSKLSLSILPNDIINIISSYAFPPLLTFTERLEQSAQQARISK